MKVLLTVSSPSQFTEDKLQLKRNQFQNTFINISCLVWFSSDYYVCIFRVYWLQYEYSTEVSHLCSSSSLLWGFSFLQNLFSSISGWPHDTLPALWHANGEVLYFVEVTCRCWSPPGENCPCGDHCSTKTVWPSPPLTQWQSVRIIKVGKNL